MDKVQEMTSSEMDILIALITHNIAQNAISEMSKDVDSVTIRELRGIDFWLNVT